MAANRELRYPGLTLADLRALSAINISGVVENPLSEKQMNELTHILRNSSEKEYLARRIRGVDLKVDDFVSLFMLPSWEIMPTEAQDVMRKIVHFEVGLFSETICEGSILAKALETVGK